jgi:hypothetical protein
VVTVEEVAVKVAEVAPEPTVTEDGTERAELLSDSETTDPPLGAAFDRLTVQVAFDPPFTLAGLQVKEETVGRVDPVPTMGVFMSV